ncbi:MAG: endo-1,4-beta-xylanase [Anaerolineae bacterium]|nr:endo-1,4-beta-xylanase [Anaerolineae bacterium]
MSTLDQEIRQQRSANATVTLFRNGSPLSNREITLEQKKHKMLLGSNWGNSSIQLANGELTGEAKELAERRNQHFLALFNQATLPFYWGRFEPKRGQPDTQRILKAAKWYQDNGCVVKGHPLCWHTVTADWLLELSNREILEAQIGRIKREVADFAGVIDMWDVVNEAVIMPVFDKYDNGITRICKDLGRIELIRTMFETARATNPNVTLLLNDFDVSSAFDILVEGCLEAGIQIDVIGIQSHMHQGYWGEEKTQRVLEHFARFKLPIHFTEITIVSGKIMPPEIEDLNDYQVTEWPSTPEGEERQLNEVISFYKTLLANPQVEAITWWDFTDGGWLNAPAGLLRKDQTPKPAYEELLRLFKGEWWVKPTKIVTDANGEFKFTGFLGDYAVTAGDRTTNFSLNENGAASVSLNF